MYKTKSYMTIKTRLDIETKRVIRKQCKISTIEKFTKKIRKEKWKKIIERDYE